MLYQRCYESTHGIVGGSKETSEGEGEVQGPTKLMGAARELWVGQQALMK